MHGNTLKRALVVASVSLTLPVLGAGAASAVGNDGHANGKGSGSDSAPARSAHGKGSSTPDQDGKGMDRGADNNDKTGPGTDGNNGCGNEPRLAAPRDGGRPTDDDNNGWCGSKPRPAHEAPEAEAPGGTSTVPPVVVTPVVSPAAPATPVSTSGTSAGTSGAAGTSVPSRTEGFGGGVLSANGVAGDTVAAQAASGPTALPFTGAPIGLLVLLGGSAAAAGAVLTAAGRKRSA